MNLPPPTLQYTTNHAHIDALLRGLVGLCELTFPERIQAYYLVGSYADGSAVPSSDLDLLIIFGDDLHDRERTTISQLLEACRLISPIRLDLNVVGEQQLRTGVPGTRKVAKLLYGTPILDALPLAPRDQHLQRSLRNAFHTSYLLRQRAENLMFPLTYPDPTGDFYGYEQMGQVRALISGPVANVAFEVHFDLTPAARRSARSVARSRRQAPRHSTR